MIRLLAPLSLIALALPLSAQDKKVDFAKSIWPIFERHCIECHSAEKTGDDGRVKKPKGHVELDSKDGIIKSKRGKLIRSGWPADQHDFIELCQVGRVGPVQLCQDFAMWKPRTILDLVRQRQLQLV